MSGTALVLGGTGVLGGALCDRFSALGYDVLGTGRAPGPGQATRRGGVELLALDVTDETGWHEALRKITSRRPDVIVDAVGEYTPGSLYDDRRRAERVLWANSLARGRFLHLLVAQLPPKSAIVRMDSSLGDHPSVTDSLASAAKAADRVVTLTLFHECRRRGVPFSSFVLTAVRESLDARQHARFVEQFGHEPPTAAVIAEAVAGLAAIARLSPGGTRLWFPWHGISGDPMAGVQ